ncbi:MAG: helix-turn-helix transcriptional regulator [Deltaproteobacteria bacterium]|nr:helix-turn-helix transcriptional regulator [Deltaproteobacteria bacterium]
MDLLSERHSGVEITKALGKRIRQLRQSRPEKLTQEDLAERADISVSFLSMIERGERAPHIETLIRVAAALDVSISELFLFAESEEEPKVLDPMLKPLAEFVRSHSLTRRDIDRLLGVARAMFKS